MSHCLVSRAGFTSNFCPSPKPFHCTQLAIKGCLSRRSRRRICRERRGVLGRREEGAAGALCCSAQSLQEEEGGTRRGQEVQEGGAVVRNRPALSHQLYLNPGHPSQCFSQLQKYLYNPTTRLRNSSSSVLVLHVTKNPAAAISHR